MTSGTTGVVSIVNDCASDIDLTFTLRSGSLGFSLAPDPGTMVVPAGSSDSVSIAYTAPEAALVDDILFVEVVSPEEGHRPITLHGRW